MNFSFKKDSPETVVVDAGLTRDSLPKPSRWMKFLRPMSVLSLVLALCFQMLFGGSLLGKREVLVKRWYQLLEQKKTEQQNVESLQSLLSQIDSLRDEQELFSQAVPADPRYDLVMSWIEELFERLRQKSFVELPELISWRSVSEHDVKSSDLEAVGITEYSFSFAGEYHLLMDFFAALRESQRLLDVRALRNLSLREDGLVAVDIELWSYHSSF